MNFSDALNLLKQGYCIKRKSWKNQKLKIELGSIVVDVKGQPFTEVVDMESYELLADDWLALNKNEY